MIKCLPNKFKSLVVIHGKQDDVDLAEQVSSSIRTLPDCFYLFAGDINQVPSWTNSANCILAKEDIGLTWMYIGAFNSQNQQIFIFCDDETKYAPHFQSLQLSVLQKHELTVKSLWNEPIQKQELILLKDYLKKFIKHLATGSNQVQSLPYFKLLHITDNLCKTNRNRSEKDLSSLFVKSMFSDGLLENDMIKREILAPNAPESIEEIFRVRLGEKLRTIIHTIQNKVSEQKLAKQTQIQEDVQVVTKPAEEPDILKTAIESVFTQYQSLFEKAKIHEVKKIAGVTRQVVNYFNGYVKRMGGDQATFLQNQESFVCGNVLLSLNRLGAFKLITGNSVEHADPTFVKNMQFKMDPQGEDIEFLQKILADPGTHLPNRQSNVVKQDLLITAPIFVPINTRFQPQKQPTKKSQIYSSEKIKKQSMPNHKLSRHQNAI